MTRNVVLNPIISHQLFPETAMSASEKDVYAWPCEKSSVLLVWLKVFLDKCRFTPLSHNLTPCVFQLQTLNSTKIHCYAARTFILNIGRRRDLTRTSVQANTKMKILHDFLSMFSFFLYIYI